MFNIDKFDLDFDDSFPINIFGERRGTVGNESDENERVSEGSEILKQGRSKCEKTESRPRSKENKTECNVSRNNFPECTLAKGSKGNLSNLKRYSTQDEKSNKRKLSHEFLLQRRFPGPAGLLPDKPFREIGEVILMDKPNGEDESEKDKQIYSQSSGSVFLESPFQKLISDFDLNEGSHLNKYTIEWVKKTAINKGLQGRKVPFLAVVLHCVNHSMPDPVLLLRDPTGEINGTLHREVWADLGGKLQAGIALALRQVGVLITGVIRRQIHLNITINNILAIYRHSEEKNGVEMTPVNKASKAELLKSLESWQVQNTRPQFPGHHLPTALFSTVYDSRPNEITNSRSKLNNFAHVSKEREPQCSEGVSGGGGRKTEEVLADLGIVLTDGDFNDEMNVPPSSPNPSTNNSQKDFQSQATSNPLITASQVLSQAENLLFQEVLNGINFDDFEM